MTAAIHHRPRVASSVRPWSEYERHDLMLMRAAGVHYPDAASRLGRPVDECRAQVKAVLAEERKHHAIRDCLTCRRPFASAGPQNRMCDRCKKEAPAWP
jgi:hypothetical protein